MPAPPRRIVVVTGLSGAGKASMLRVLEDLGYEAVDNPPLLLMEELARSGEAPLAVGVDARSRGFDVLAVLAVMARLRANPGLRPELVFAHADDGVLLRRFTETRRRHPLAPRGPVCEGIAAERRLLAPLREAADLILDTSDTPLPEMRRMVEARFGGGQPGAALTLALISFAYPLGLPREADLVFDARFLRNPHYDTILRELTGLDAAVAAHVAADPDYPAYVTKMTELLDMLLPRFVREGKKYATVAIGCTGGRHRSVHLVEVVAAYLGAPRTGAKPWRVAVSHRDIGRPSAIVKPAEAEYAAGRRTEDRTGAHSPAQAQEA